MALTKTQDISVLTIQQVAANAVVNSAALDVSAYLSVLLAVNIGRDDTGGALTSGAIVRVQASPKPSGDDAWRDLAVFQTQVTTPESESVSSTANSGQAVLPVASTSNLAVEDLILIKNGTIGNSEFHRIKAVSSNTSVTVDDNLTNSQTSSTIYDQAELFLVQLDVLPFSRLRVQIDNAANSRTIVAQAYASAGVV